MQQVRKIGHMAATCRAEGREESTDWRPELETTEPSNDKGLLVVIVMPESAGKTK